jgi:hypothetical protein
MLSRKRHPHLITVCGLVLLAFLLRAATLDVQSMWRDEVDALRFATSPWSEMLANFTRPGWNGPLYYLLLRGWIAGAGTSEFALRFFSLCLGVLCVPLMVVLGRQLFSLSVGLISALLVATSPYLVWYSQEVKMYTLVSMLGLLAIYGLCRALKGGGWPWWLAQMAATSLAFYSHILAALLILVQVLIAFAWWPRLRRRWREALVSLACLTLPYLPLVVWQAPLALEARDTGFHAYSLNQMVVILLYAWSTGITEWGRPWGPALMGLLALGGIGAAISALPPFFGHRTQRVTESGTARHAMLAVWLLVPLLCIWIISLRQPLFTDRYLIWSAPAFYLLVAYTLARFASGEGSGRLAGLLLTGVILTLSGFNLWRQVATPIKSDFRAAASYVASYDGPGSLSERFQAEGQPPDQGAESLAGHPAFDDLIIFQIPYGRYTFEYYFPFEGYPWADGPYTNHRYPNGAYRMSAQRAAERLQEMTRGHGVAWLVATEVSMWDERNLTQQWLEQRAIDVSAAHFTRVDVYRYHLLDASGG